MGAALAYWIGTWAFKQIILGSSFGRYLWIFWNLFGKLIEILKSYFLLVSDVIGLKRKYKLDFKSRLSIGSRRNPRLMFKICEKYKASYV